MKEPFAGRNRDELIVHVSHHRAGTAWFSTVLHALARHFGVPFSRETGPHPGRAVVLLDAGIFDEEGAQDFRGSHMIRDPRDMVVSGYHYHLWTSEPWAHRPNEELGGRSYQEHLRLLSREEGLREEIVYFRPIAEAMATWDYGDERFLELRYEEMLVDEEDWFARLFSHYGLTPGAAARALKLARRFSFGEVTGRRLGHVEPGHHIRSGRPGQWLDELTIEHCELLDEVTDHLPVRLGYPPDPRRVGNGIAQMAPQTPSDSSGSA